MQDKTRLKHRYLQEFCKWHQRHLCAINMNCDTRRRNRVHFFGKAKIRREDTMKTTSEQDTGFCAECKTLRISQICSQNSTTGFDHRVQNALRVQNAVSLVSKFAVGAHFRGCVLAGEYCLRIRIRWRSMDWCTFSRVLIFAGTPALPSLDNPPQLCTCTNTRARLLNPTNAASCRHRSWTRTGTNIRASWLSSYRRCIASSSGPGQVYAHMVSQAGTVHTGVASC